MVIVEKKNDGNSKNKEGTAGMSPLGLGLGRSLIKENWDYRRRQKHLLEFSSSSVIR